MEPWFILWSFFLLRLLCISISLLYSHAWNIVFMCGLVGSILEEKSSGCWGWLSLLNWIGTLTLSQLLKLPPRKLEPWFILRSFFLLRLLCISINLSYSHAWNIVFMSSLVLLVATWSCWISYKNMICRTVGLLLAVSLEHLAHCWNVASLSLFYRYYFDRCSFELALKGGLLVILIDWMIFLSPFLDVMRRSISTVSFLTQLDCGIICL